MSFISDFSEKIYTLHSWVLKRYIAVAVIAFISIIISIQAVFIFYQRSLRQVAVKLSENREKIKRLVKKKLSAEDSKVKVDEDLKKNLSFRIKEYVISVLDRNSLIDNLSGDYDSIRESSSKSGYKELSLSFELQDLTTEQLVTILSDMESDKKVLFREIVVKRGSLEDKVSLFATIATAKLLT
jgi:hypothetical protein